MAAGAVEAEDVLVEEAEETVVSAVEDAAWLTSESSPVLERARKEPAPDPDPEAKENSSVAATVPRAFVLF